VPNPEIAGNPGEYLVKPWLQSPPGLSSRDAVKRRLQILGAAVASGLDSRGRTIFAPYAEQGQHLSINAARAAFEQAFYNPAQAPE
jgi:hypothetical protein